MRHTQGSTLLVTLVLLLILTLLAVNGMQYNTLQTRIATNSADENIAFYTAEGVLNQGINFVLSGNYTPSTFLANTKGLYTFNASNPPLWITVNWNNTNAVILGYQGKSISRGAYIIEQLPSVIQPGQNMKNPTLIFRITARASGASGKSIVMLQSTVQVPQY